jgi:hypothetical protein
MKLCTRLALTVLLAAMALPAAVLYGSYQDFAVGTSVVGTIDSKTGAIQPIASVTGTTGTGFSTFDPQTPAYYFCGVDTSSQVRLYSVNLRTRTFTSSAPLPQFPNAIQFDPVSRSVVGTFYNVNTETLIAGRIDATTGSVTPIATVSTTSFGSDIGISALDPLSRSFYFYNVDLVTGVRLIAMNIDTGSMTASPNVTETPWAMQFDPITRTIFVTTYVPGVNTVGVGKIDPATGSIRHLVNVGNSLSPGFQGVSAFDPVSRVYSFYAGPYNSPENLYTVDVRSGTFTTVSAVALVPAGMESGDF